MARPNRRFLLAEARRMGREHGALLGRELRASRTRRRLTQTQVGVLVDLSKSAVSKAERGFGGSLSLDTWQSLFLALDRRLVVDVSRDAAAEPLDAGHLALQELVLRATQAAGIVRSFELPVPGAHGRHSIDVFLRCDRHRCLTVCECWNTLDDIGAATRSFNWKLTKAAEAAVAVGGTRAYAVNGVWVIRSTARNRGLVARYPHVFAARFPGSSAAWLSALTTDGPPPAAPGIVWADAAATRLFARRVSAA